MKIGTYTKEQQRINNRKISREIELENKTGWTAIHKTHKSKKNYSRKNKHKSFEY
jgi:hypothetical protein